VVPNPQSAIFRPGILDGKICVVSGFGSGLGRASSIELARLGAFVIGCGRKPDKLESVCAEIKEMGGQAWAQSVDIRDEEQVSSFYDEVMGRHGRIDVLYNNAGGQFYSPAEDVTVKGLRATIELNLLGTWSMTREAANRAFIPQRSGRVITITASPHNGIAGFMATSAARAAVENMTRSLSLEWGRYNIKLCAIAAGAFETEIVSSKYPPEMVAEWGAMTSIGRIGTMDELAWFVAYLASPAAGYFTGSVLTMDGGRDNGLPPSPTHFLKEERKPNA
jgi:citronellol/citronellal dehydrogenase